MSGCSTNLRPRRSSVGHARRPMSLSPGTGAYLHALPPSPALSSVHLSSGVLEPEIAPLLAFPPGFEPGYVQPIEPPVEAPALRFCFNPPVPFAGSHRLISGLLAEQAREQAAMPVVDELAEVVVEEVAAETPVNPASAPGRSATADELVEGTSAEIALRAAEVEASRLQNAAGRLREEADELGARAEKIIFEARRDHRRSLRQQSTAAGTVPPALGPAESGSVLGKRAVLVDNSLPPSDALAKRVKRD